MTVKTIKGMEIESGCDTDTIKDEKDQLVWEAYCPTCKLQGEACANGNFAESVARMHTQATGHECICGYRFHKS